MAAASNSNINIDEDPPGQLARLHKDVQRAEAAFVERYCRYQRSKRRYTRAEKRLGQTLDALIPLLHKRGIDHDDEIAIKWAAAEDDQVARAKIAQSLNERIRECQYTREQVEQDDLFWKHLSGADADQLRDVSSCLDIAGHAGLGMYRCRFTTALRYCEACEALGLRNCVRPPAEQMARWEIYLQEREDFYRLLEIERDELFHDESADSLEERSRDPLQFRELIGAQTPRMIACGATRCYYPLCGEKARHFLIGHPARRCCANHLPQINATAAPIPVVGATVKDGQ